MKKSAVITLILAILMLGASCSNNNKEQKVTAYTVKTSEAPSTATEVDVKADKVEKITKRTDPTSKKPKRKKETTQPIDVPTQGVTKRGMRVVVTTVKGSFSSSDLDFIYGSSIISLNEKISDVFESIGEDNFVTPLSKNKTEYDYDDFIITTYMSEDIERVEQITVMDDSISTAKGAKIGMYATQLRRVYGDPIKSKGNVVTYGSGNKTLEFTSEDNIVTGFTYKYKH